MEKNITKNGHMDQTGAEAYMRKLIEQGGHKELAGIEASIFEQMATAKQEADELVKQIQERRGQVAHLQEEIAKMERTVHLINGRYSGAADLLVHAEDERRMKAKEKNA
jgi:polyhydroxyalkanoate synthesis regulator phasin